MCLSAICKSVVTCLFTCTFVFKGTPQRGLTGKQLIPQSTPGLECSVSFKQSTLAAVTIPAHVRFRRKAWRSPVKTRLLQGAPSYCVLGQGMALLVLDKEWEKIEKAVAERGEGRHWWSCAEGWVSPRVPPQEVSSRPPGAAVSGLVCRKQRVAKDCLGCGHDLGRGLKQGSADGPRP